jgi:hypothetical protein
LPGELESPEFPRRALLEVLGNLERRLREGPDAPLRVALFGPTGAGKSKIFNSLVGGELSPAGFRRPFTLRSVYLVHEARREEVFSPGGDVKPTSDVLWRDVVLVDTPDFDSVEKHNREEAERVFREADAFVFVTDVQKYADHSTWQYLERICLEKKPAIIVLNKVEGDAPARDFFSRLDQRFSGGSWGKERFVIREYPLGDASLLPAEDPGLARTRGALSALAGSPAERRAALIATFRDDMERFLDLWKSASARLEGARDSLSGLLARLGERCSRGELELQSRLETSVDPALKAEVYARVLQRLQKIDILRYPRKLLSLPLEGIKSLVKKWIPARRGGRPSGEGGARSESFQALEARLLELADETWEDFQGDAVGRDFLGRKDYLALRITHDELLEKTKGREQAFAEWLRREAQETASALTGEHKLKFILSQVIYNSVIVGIQIHTAGGFTLAELVTDSVLSPVVAKAVGMAVSSESVRKFEKRARAEHHRLLVDVLREARDRFAGHIESRRAWAPAYQELEARVSALRDGREDLLREFGAAAPPGSRKGEEVDHG